MAINAIVPNDKPSDAVTYECHQCAEDIRNIETLAEGIYFEARSEPTLGQIAVGYVITNRTEDTRYPDSINEVITQDGNPGKQNCQFSYTCDNVPDKITDLDAWEEAKQNATLVYHKKVADPTHGSLYYKNPKKSKQKWSVSGKTVAIGNHTFYKSL